MKIISNILGDNKAYYSVDLKKILIIRLTWVILPG